MFQGRQFSRSHLNTRKPHYSIEDHYSVLAIDPQKEIKTFPLTKINASSRRVSTVVKGEQVLGLMSP